MSCRRTAPLLLAILVIVPTAAAQDGHLWVGPNVNMVSGTTWPDGDPFLQRQNEPSVAGSTRDTMTMMGFVNDYRSVDIPGLPEGKETGDSWLGVFKSFDGGLTWKSTLLPGYPQDQSSPPSPIHGYDAGADPVVRAGTHGLFYLTGIVFDRGDFARSGVFLTRYMDLNNRESGDPIEYIDTQMVKSNEVGDYFIDKPWMAVDIPRSGAQSVQLEIFQDESRVYQDVECGNVYLAWAEIQGVPPNRRSAIMFTRSEDCGETWDTPTQLSAPDTLNQGVTVAVSPTYGDVWVAWRQFDIANVITSCAIGGGYWKNHPEEWPVEFITMGGVGYDKASALDILNTPTRGDATFILARQLIPAKLNVASGVLDAGLINTIAAADAWLVANPLGDNNKPEGTVKDEGLEIKDMLEAYNEGLIIPESCPPPAASGDTGNAIVAVHSNGFGGIGTFTTPTVVSTLFPLEQATTSISFRTNAYPTITVGTSENEADRAYLAWTTRGEALPRTDPIEGDGRIVVSTSINGVDWTLPSPALADQPGVPGHQLKPTITFAGGKVLLAYVDLRYDHSGVFERFIADWPSMDNYRHTVDVRAAQADPVDVPIFTDYSLVEGWPSDQVSRYVFIPYPADPDAPDPYDLELLQFQFNPPNLPIFVGGTRPFFGDYIDIGASPPFVPDLNNGGWRYNTDPGDGVTFHAVWTDNRDVEAPHDGDWSNYVPPQHFNSGGPSLFDPNEIVPDCEATPGGYGQTRIRDQNTYTARISRGLFVASPGSSRATDTVQRAFVVFVQNDTQEVRAFHLDIPGQSGVNASFEQFSSLAHLEMEIPGFSSASRTVFVDSPLERPSVPVNVVEINGLGGSPIYGGLASSILLNPDPTSPPPADYQLNDGEIYNLAMMNPAMMNLAMMNPAMMNVAMMNLAMMNPAMMNLAMMNPAMMNLALMNLAMMNPAMMNPAMMNQAVYSLAMMNPAMMNPAMMNLAMMNPAMMNLAMMNPAMMNASLTDLTWEVEHTGNAAAAYSVNMVMEEPPEGFVYELLIYRLYTTPVADGCKLTEEAQHQMLVHIIDPDLLTGDLLDPGNTDPDLGNATFWMEPGDHVYVTLRVVDLEASDDVIFDPTELSVATVAQGVNTEDALAGSTQPPYDVQLSPSAAPSDLVSWWTGDSNAADLAGPNDGTLFNGATYAPGLFNDAFSFDGTGGIPEQDGHFVVAPSVGIDGLEQLTVSAWATLDTLPGKIQRFFTLGPGTVVLRNDGHPLDPAQYHVYMLFDDGLHHIRVSDILQVGCFHHVAATYDGTTMRAYLDGFEVGNHSVVGVLGAGLSDDVEFSSPGEPLDGLIDDVRVYSRAFDAAEIQALYDAGGAGRCDTPEVPRLLFVSQPHGTRAGDDIGPVEMRLLDKFGAPINGAVVEVALGNSPCSGASLTGAGTYSTFPDGTFPVTTPSIDRGGWGYTLTASTTGSDPVTAISEPFNVEGFCQADGMNYPKLGATITTLQDGRVLVAGGNPAGNFSEIFDPEAGPEGLWTRFLHGGVGGLGILRALHTATLLHDGTVLITGGYAGLLPAGGGALDSVVIFDPATGTFTRQVETLTVPRMEHTATLLADGRVLIAGGLSNAGDSTYLNSAEIYDPSDGSITSVANPMFSSRAHHTATPLSNGTVLLVGGLLGPFSYLRSAEIFDPLTGGGTFTEVTIGMTESRINHTATLLTNGKVLVAGGHNGLGTVLPTADVYDPVTDSFWPIPGGMTTRRTLHTAAPLPDGRVLITGGDNGSGAIATAEVYDRIANGFFPAGSMGSARSNHLAASLHDGRVLVAGASGLSSELYLPAFPARFRAVDGLSDKRAQHTAIQIFGGDVLVLGGTRPHPSLPPGWLEGSVTIERFDAATGDFTTVASLPEPRWQQSATRLLDGDVLIAGGITGLGGSAMSSALRYDPESNTITATGSMNVARWGHSATLLADGRVLIARGRNPGNVLIDVAEIYDPVSGTFTFTGSMPDDRSAHTATLLRDGRVLIAGGRSSGGMDPSLVSALIYTPSTGLFTSVGDMNEGRQGHGATLLQDGRVLITGGAGYFLAVWLDTAEIFDPDTNSFSYTASTMKVPRSHHTSTLLENGTVLIAGGHTGENEFVVLPTVLTSSAELFDPVTDTFSFTGVMNTARSTFTATNLDDGTVLVVGGWEAYGISGLVYVPAITAEIYDPD